MEVDHPHAVSIVVIDTPMIGLPIDLNGLSLIDLGRFTIQKIVDIFIVVYNLFWILFIFQLLQACNLHW